MNSPSNSNSPVVVVLDRNQNMEAHLPENKNCFLCGKRGDLVMSEMSARVLLREKTVFYKNQIDNKEIQHLIPLSDNEYLHFKNNFASCTACHENINLLWNLKTELFSVQRKIQEEVNVGKEKLVLKCEKVWIGMGKI